MNGRTQCSQCLQDVSGYNTCPSCTFPVFNYTYGMYSLFPEPPKHTSEIAVSPTATCSICLEDLDRGMSIDQCGHVFHSECLDAWLSEHKSCPMCRVNIVQW